MFAFQVDATELRQAIGKPFLTIENIGDVLLKLGTYAMAEVKENFEALSNRGVGVDGAKWKELALSTEIVKAEKKGWRPSFKKKSEAASGIFGALRDIKQGVTTYRGRGRNKFPVKNFYGQSKRDTPPGSLIGVDDGLMRNAVVPGYSGADKIFRVNAQKRNVTIGFGRDYAKDFDRVRPLIPDATPDEWVKEMESILADFAEDLLRHRLAG